jgi:hypothetical protein
MLTSDRTAQVFLLYHRQNYDRGFGALGIRENGTLLCYRSRWDRPRGYKLARNSMSSFGTAMLYQTGCASSTDRIGDRLKHLKRKENAPIVSFEFVSAQKSAAPDETIKRNNINMLAHRFCIAPMMDWTGTSQKAKYNQHLSLEPIGRVVPNEVPRR